MSKEMTDTFIKYCLSCIKKVMGLFISLWNMIMPRDDAPSQQQRTRRRRKKKGKTASRNNTRACRKRQKRKSAPKNKQTQRVLQRERPEQENIRAELNSSLTDRQLGHETDSVHHTKPREVKDKIQKQTKSVTRGRKNSKNKKKFSRDPPVSYMKVSSPMEKANAHANDFEASNFKKENVVFPELDDTYFSPESFSDLKLLNITTETEDWYEISIRKYTHNQNEDVEIENINISHSQMKTFQKERSDSQFYDDLMTNSGILDNLIKQNPKIYKRCQLKIESSHKATAIVLDKCSSFSKITISGRSKCGQTYNDDEVVVQVLREPRQPPGRQTSSTNHQSRSQNEAYGRVVGVYLSKRPDVKFQVLTCTLDEFEGHLMRPLCKTVPKIHVLNETVRSQHPDERKHLIEVKGIQNGKITHKRFVKIDPDKRQDYVFRVVLLAWRKSEIYPLGAVLDAFITGQDFSNGLDVLALKHRLPRLFPRKVITEIQNSLENAGQRMVDGRKDLTKERIFTVDPLASKDLDDALSIKEEGDFTIVGVHIADVAAAVAERSAIDEEARKRGMTFYPSSRRPHPMLPEPLSRGTCSLLPGQERLAISVFFKFDKEGRFKDEPVVAKTVIKSCKQFSYKDVQRIICNCDEDSEESIEKDVIHLHKISSKLRYQRLENGDLSIPFEDPRLQDVDEGMENPDAHSLVEEFMIITNEYIARRLSQNPKLSSLLILRTQKQPTSEQLKEWFSNEGALGHLVMKLQGQKINKSIQLSASCMKEQDDQYVIVQRSLWTKLCYCLQNDNIEEIRKIIFMDNAHSLQCLALQHWLEMMETAEYKCGDGLSKENALHFGLQVDRYTHVTSPIRRYVDLHVQRLVHADLDGTDVNCTVKEVIQLCQELNTIAARQKAFGKECQALAIADTLRSGPLNFRAYVDELSSDKMVLHLPSLQKVSSRKQELHFNLLGAVQQPEVIAPATKREKVKVHVKPVVYCVRSEDRNELDKRRKYGDLSSPKIFLNHDQIGVLVKQKDWSSLVKMLLNNQRSESGCRPLIPVSSVAATKGASHVTSDNSDGTTAMHPRLYEMEFSRGQIVQVQMSAKADKGILAAQIETVRISQNVLICMCHSRDPVSTLSRTSVQCTKGKRFTKYTEYMSTWMRLLEVEAAYEAGSNAPGIILESINVKIKRTNNSKGQVNQSVFSGTFQLPTAFCYDRGIEFAGVKAYSIRPENDLKGSRSCPLDYLCLRFHTKCASSTVSKVKNSVAHPIIDVDYSWIGHGLIVSVSRTKGNKSEGSKRAYKNGCNGYEDKDDISVDFLLTHNSPEPPPELLRTNDSAVTLEILLKGEAVRRAQEILCKLKDDDCELARAIAYDKSLPHLDADHHAFGTAKKNHDVQLKPSESLPKNNPQQQKAIHLALTSPLSVIQGPPGTGKTYTGIKLVYLFCKINKEMEQNGQGKRTVLYCGPSNKSVDHVAKQLKKHLGDKCPKRLRIYGSVIEDKDFPVPRKSHGMRYANPDLKSDIDLQDISLHFIIRQDGKPYAEEINKYDKIFQKIKQYSAETITREVLEKYRTLVIKAGKEEMIHYDVILTTCAVGGSQMCVEGVQNSVFQIIVDESAMIPEPFCLVPIVAHKAKQVVLIGDHKQLRPVIQCKAAADLGLDQSLFERLFTQYSKQSMSLNWQYRMHPAISEFPSQEFYNGQLETRLSPLWTGSPLPFWSLLRNERVPHLFVDVRGQEEMLTVTTDEGNEKSKSNKQEARKVVDIFKFLNTEHGVDIKTIKILTQYNAQRNLIENELKKLCDDQHDLNRNQISTVVSSQGGEWDYVILSTVRSLPPHQLEKRPTHGWCIQNMGFITDKNQINVALTRARRGLIIVGNKELLKCDQFWGRLIERYEKMRCVRRGGEFPYPRFGNGC